MCAGEGGLTRATIHSEDFLQWAIDHFAARSGGSMRSSAIRPLFGISIFLDLPVSRRADLLTARASIYQTTNAWVPFILASMELLRPGGRLAMVVPSEIIHVTHAQSLRSYLGQRVSSLVIVDPEEISFSETLQGAVLLLAEKKRREAATAEGSRHVPRKGPGVS